MARKQVRPLAGIAVRQPASQPAAAAVRAAAAATAVLNIGTQSQRCLHAHSTTELTAETSSPTSLS